MSNIEIRSGVSSRPCIGRRKDGTLAVSLRRTAVIFAACFALYLLVVEAFIAVPQFNDVVQIRPASALGPVLGLFFGLPGILE